MKKLFFSFALLSATVAAMAAPTTPAPLPTWPADQVMAVYSDSYELQANWGYLEGWGQTTTLEAKEIDGNHYLAYSNFNYLGWGCVASYNVMTMEKLHLDIWADEAGKIGIVPIYGGPGLTTDDNQRKIVDLEAGKWNSIDLDLKADYPNLDLSSIFQFKYDNGTITTFALDNVFFYRTTVLVDNEAPKNLKAELASASYFSVVLKVSATDDKGLVNFIVMDGDNKVANGSASSGVETNLTVDKLQPNTAYSFSVIAQDPSGNASDPVAVNASTIALPAACPAPTAPTEGVKSLYSDVFEPMTTVNNFCEWWWQAPILVQATMAEVDQALYYSGATDGCAWGWAFNECDASGFQKLHISVYPLQTGKLEIYPVLPAPTGEVHLLTEALEANKWNDVVLDYTDKTFGPFKQLGWITREGLQEFFIDNVYFFDETITALEQIEVGTNVQKVLRDGQLFILRDGEVYTLQGAIVR